MQVLGFQMHGASIGLRLHRRTLMLLVLSGPLCGAFTSTIVGAQDVKPSQDPNLVSLPPGALPGSDVLDDASRKNRARAGRCLCDCTSSDI